MVRKPGNNPPRPCSLMTSGCLVHAALSKTAIATASSSGLTHERHL
ncbi:MAG TPA: hypothetical protein V6C85_24235 [Allocoleopsis sp.]